jgi:sirohydrochlorin ferrochelatase
MNAPPALVLAAHGERRNGADNEGVARLAARLRARGIAAGYGFIKGAPSIAEAVARFSDQDILVYPLFLADGYFTRTLLPQRLAQAGAFSRDRAVEILPPLGLDPALAPLVSARAVVEAESRGWAAEHTEVVLLAHGSRSNTASRIAAERLAEQVAASHAFAGQHVALLEEPPALGAVVSTLSGPVVVVGLFVGEGLHGGGDAPRLVANIDRPDVVFAGNIGGSEGLVDIIAAAARADGMAMRKNPALGPAAVHCSNRVDPNCSDNRT